MRGSVRKFKKGIASFYIVAFSTLIMVIIAVSFATVVISEIARTSNDDLSQSAYDAALAGVEDAKLAYANYQSCLKKGAEVGDIDSSDGVVTCGEILYWMQHPDCDMVAHILNRYGPNMNGEVKISETQTNGSNNLQQAYTCVKILTNLADYRASLSSSTPYKVVKVELKDEGLVSSISKVRLSWYSNREGRIYNYNNFPDSASSVIFPSLGLKKAATPPTLAVEMIQTAPNFAMSELNSHTNNDGETDRATLYLVPSNDAGKASKTTLLMGSTYIGAYSNESKINRITAAQVASTNNAAKNLPYAVYCPDNSNDEFACSVEIGIPDPIDQIDGRSSGKRNADTFIFVVSLPYEQPDVDFAMEFCTNDGTCSAGAVSEINLNNAQNDGLVTLNNMQAAIDSTGRANNLFRRVETRIEMTDASFSYPLYAIEALNSENGNDAVIDKRLTVTEESSTYSNLPSFEAITTSTYKVTVCPKVDGEEICDRNSKFWFEVRVDGSSLGTFTYYSNYFVEGTMVTATPIGVEGYAPGETVGGAVSDDTTLTPAWTALRHSVKVMTEVDGRVYDSYEGLTYNISMSDGTFAANVDSFSIDGVKYGTEIEVTPSWKTNGCSAESIKKTVTKDLTITVRWTGACIAHLKVDTAVDDSSAVNGNFTFNIYYNNNPTAVASDVTYFDEEVAVGTMVLIRPNRMEGYSAVQNEVMIESISGIQDVTLNWQINYYPVDVNPVIDGVPYDQGKDGFEFEVFLNGTKVAESYGPEYYYTKIDYYNANVKYGTLVKVIPKKVDGYDKPVEVSGYVGEGGLVLFPVWHKGSYVVDVNEIVNGRTFDGGVQGLSFDVYVDNARVARDVADYYNETVGYGKTVKVEAKNADGYTLLTPVLEVPVEGPTTLNLAWNGNAVYYVDVNEVVNGVLSSTGYNGFNFSVIINNKTVASDTQDWDGYVVAGSSVRVVATGKANYRLTNGDETRVANSYLEFNPTWTAGKTTIIYNKNASDATGLMDPQEILSGSSENLYNNGFERAGYDFNGWNTAAGGSGTAYNNGQIYSPNGENDVTLTLYAQWKARPAIKITYNGNGQTSGSMSTQNTTQGQIVTLKSNAYSRTGYEFAGWNTSSNGNGTGYSNGQQVSFDSNVTLYAQWNFIGTYMQDFTNAQCQSLASASDYTVFDRRDMRAYTVRYANGRCWMTSDLMISGQISSTYSNFSSPSVLELRSGFSSSLTEPYGGDGDYNYCAARAGNSNSCSAWGWDSENSGDICPANWQIPSMSLMSGIRTNSDVFTSSSYGYWWTSTTLGSPDSGDSMLECVLERSGNDFIFERYTSSCKSGRRYYGYYRDNFEQIRCVHK